MIEILLSVIGIVVTVISIIVTLISIIQTCRKDIHQKSNRPRPKE
ncbi:hypothetical protein [Suilimivivens sp.]